MDILAYIDRIEDLYGNVLPKRKPPRPIADQYQDYKQVQGMFEPRTQMYIEKEMGFDEGGQVIGKPGGLVEPGVTHYGKAKVDDPGSNVTAGQDLGTGVSQRVRKGRIRYIAQHGSTGSMKEKKARVFEYSTLEEAKNRRKELIETYGEIDRVRPEKQTFTWEKMNEDPDFEEFFKKEIKENPNIKKVADKYNLGENNLEELFNKVRDEVNVSEGLKKGRASYKGRERLIHPLTLRRLNVKFVYTYKPSVGTIDVKELAKHSHLSKNEISKLLGNAERPPVDPLFGKTSAGIWEESAIKRGKYFKKVLEDIGITVDKRPADPQRTVRNITDKRIGRYIIKANPEQLKKLSETRIFKKGEGVPVRQKDIYSSLSKASDEYIKFGYSQDRRGVTELAKAINRSMDAMSFDELATYIKKNKKLRDLVELSFDGVTGTFTKVSIDDMTEAQLRQFSKMEADHIRGRSTVKFDDATRKILSGIDIEYPRNLYIIPKGINQSVKQKVENWIADHPNEIKKIKNIDQKFKDAQISYWNKNTGSYGGYKPKASAVDLTHLDIDVEELLNKHTTYIDDQGVERAVIKDKDLFIKKVKALNEKRISGYLKIAKTTKGSGKIKAIASLVAIGGGYTADKLLKEHGISLTQDENEKVLEAGMLPNVIKEYPVTSAIAGTGAAIASKFTKTDPLKQVRRIPKKTLSGLWKATAALDAPLAQPLWAKMAYDSWKEDPKSFGAWEATLGPALSHLASSELGLYSKKTGLRKALDTLLRGGMSRTMAKRILPVLAKGSVWATPLMELGLRGYDTRQEILKAREELGTDNMEWTPLGKAPKELIQEWQRNIPVEGMSKTFNNPLTGKPLFTVPEVGVGEFQAANGGIASLTRTTPPTRGPQYRGLDYLKYYGR